MKLFTRLLEMLFGKKQSSLQSSKPMTETMSVPADYITRWEKERQERIAVAEHDLKDWIIEAVKKNGNLDFSWQSGNDEAFVTFKDFTDEEEGIFEDLELYMIDKLDIPDAGEFEMNGAGSIYIENNLVKTKYSSTIKGLIDFNEETEEEIYSEEEKDSGDIVLFPV